MKTTTILSAAIISATALTASAYAQNKPMVPGSETTQDTMQNNSRENVANDGAMTNMDAPKVEGSETILPGSTGNQDLQDAQTRDSVAAGTDAMGTTTGDTGMKNGAMDNAENPSAESNSDNTASPMETQGAK